jgi:hypothetical protein
VITVGAEGYTRIGAGKLGQMRLLAATVGL